jgi:hypothetical protein
MYVQLAMAYKSPTSATKKKASSTLHQNGTRPDSCRNLGTPSPNPTCFVFPNLMMPSQLLLFFSVSPHGTVPRAMDDMPTKLNNNAQRGHCSPQINT